MFDCGLCGLIGALVRSLPILVSRRHLNKPQRKPRLLKPTQIEICSRHDKKPETWDPAVLSYDPNIDHNIISRHLVEQVLSAPLHSIDEKTQPCVQTYDRSQRVVGYIDLTWCFERNNKRMQTTKFWVTDTENPCYDVILGRKDAKECGLTKARKR